MEQYTHKDWKEFKRTFKLKSKDIADLLGLSVQSVQNQCAPSKELPKWAIGLIHGCKLSIPHRGNIISNV